MNKEHAKKCCRGGGHAPMRCVCNCTCDGYHTFDELYEHRITLFIAFCKELAANRIREAIQGGMVRYAKVWRSKLHSDGTMFDGGWFILGIGKDKGDQITYHLPIAKWDETHFAETLIKAPEFDGHTSEDVLERLKRL